MNLIVASGIAGKNWARGANLKEQSGVVSVNGVKVCLNPSISIMIIYNFLQVASVFNPPWTKSNIIISEVSSELPLHAMHPYAETILDSLKPSRYYAFVHLFLIISNLIIKCIPPRLVSRFYLCDSRSCFHP